MHRMLRHVALTGLTGMSLAWLAPAAEAGLLRPNAGPSFPDISANITGVQTYVYDPGTGVGTFQVNNTPYLIAGGPTLGSEYSVTADPADGVRRQTITAALDSTGRLVAGNSMNSYELVGSVTAGGETYSGVLLTGTPTDFGSQSLKPLGINGSDIYDFNIKITGGALAQFVGPDAYMRIQPELSSTFNGDFTTDFSGMKAVSNTRGYNSVKPFPVPEPTTLVVMLAAGAVVFYRRKRIRTCDLRGGER